MELNRYSCPTCGQHVEYPEGYAGKQMKCPKCGNTIRFPGIATVGGGAVEAEAPKPVAKKRTLRVGKAFGNLRDYPHWNTILQILVPFVIIGTLLGGALWVKKKFTDEPAAAAPIAQPGSVGWDKMTQLTRADQQMQKYVQSILQTRRAVAVAQATLQNEEKRLSQVRDPDEKQAISSNVQNYERAVNQNQDRLTGLQRQFQIDYEKYRNMGGTVDYGSQVPY